MSQLPSIALAAEPGVAQDRIDTLRSHTRLPLVNLTAADVDLVLVQTAERLELRQTGKGSPGPVYADFVTGKAAHRRLQGIGRKQPIARAVGIKPGKLPSMVDATAGLGQDALILATLGCQITLIERSPIVAALLDDAMERARVSVETAPILSHMQLIQADACEYLQQLPEAQRPDVIYLDPMFPKKDKSALVKKEMRLFQQLPGTSDDAVELLPIALKIARHRVVVKRPAKAPCLAHLKPHMRVKSPRMRFDVYLIR